MRDFIKQKNNSIHDLIDKVSKYDDFHQFATKTTNGITLYFSYYKSLIDEKKMHHHLLPYIQSAEKEPKVLTDVMNVIPIEDREITSDAKAFINKLTRGYIFIHLTKTPEKGILVNLSNRTKGSRDFNDTENEYSVIGPKVGFVEDLDTNLSLLRRQITSDDLVFEEITKGSLSNTRVMIGYIDGITNPQHIQTMRQRIEDLDIDITFDSSILDQIISDNANTPFPLFMSTERLDRTTYMLLLGQVIVISDGSPYVIAGPTSIFNFFISAEDYYSPWLVGSFFRFIRFIGVLFSILATPIYVAVLTHHYEIIPEDLLTPLIMSRANVPFPPLLEALFLEITIELLREAGARLPTKVGQTLGIVGGIVLGQAAVQAALTSNILLIIVALSALASFTTPIFKMSNTIRILRFPLILLAAIWGGFGVALGLTFILCHLIRLKSLGTPYLAPVYPFRYRDLNDSFIRSSLSVTTKRFTFFKPLKLHRYNVKKHKDIEDDYNNE
ncbi:spore germination protein [Bacillus sp. Marseille-Q3570]|uniref:spore germination protein n=1 Tax=Bacillus sp. Marseille-Q3570 TaxID=2963522 RepID=UPI0021B7DC41|nr:spore germination protein [Bacillus sp. Marseille-Q3570]